MRPVSDEKPVEPAKKWRPESRSFPATPSTAKVTYEGKVWTVAEINLATGMHTITRPPNISKADLRMLDLEPFIDEDEEL